MVTVAVATAPPGVAAPSVNPFASPLEASRSIAAAPPPPMSEEFQRAVREETARVLKQQQSTTTARQLFLTSLIGCLAPILAIYGIIFLLRRPEPFPLKGLAIAGTVLHCIWTLIAVVFYGSMHLGLIKP